MSKNKYSKLINFLDNSEKKKKKAKKEKVIKKEKTKIDNLLDEIKTNTTKIKNIPVSGNGFDVKKFESLMISKLIDESKKLNSYDRSYISVNELYSCIRKCYFQRQGYSIDYNKQFNFPYLALIQNIGNKVHAFIQEIYDFTEVEKTIISEKYKVKGRVDGIKDNCLCEIKTIDDNKYQNNFIQDHFTQANIYTHVLNSEYNYKINCINIIYVLRSLKKIFSYDLKYDSDNAVSFLKNGILLKESLKNNIIPDNIGMSETQCLYCPFKNNPCKDYYNHKKIKKDIYRETQMQSEKDDVVFLI